MSTVDRVREIVAPLVVAADLELYDLALDGGILQVLVDAPGGPDIAAISRLSRQVSRALDEHDPIDGSYALEVSTPGLERPLRRPEHFTAAARSGLTAKIKTKPGTDGDRRVEGTIAAADDATVTIHGSDGVERTLRYDDIERARTTFEWGGQPKPNRKATRP
jgi:ribosome maturation factor RimP